MNKNAQIKLQYLAYDFDFETVEEMLEDAVFDSVVPAICTSKHCDHTTRLEPDAAKAKCWECGRNSVSSCLVIAELI